MVKRMKTWPLLLLLLFLSLTACYPTVPQAQMILAQATTDAQRSVEATQQQAQAWQVAADENLRATQAMETQVATTATASSLATEQTLQLTQHTWDLVQQQAEATAVAAAYTATAAYQATSDQIHFEALGTIEAAQAQMAVNSAAQADLEVERTRKMNTVIAFAPWFLGLLIFMVVLTLLWRYGNALIHQKNVVRNGNGDVETVILEGNWRRNLTLHTPAKALHPTMQLKNGEVRPIPTTNDLLQFQLTENEQKIRLARAIETQQKIRQVLLHQPLAALAHPAAPLPTPTLLPPPLPEKVLFPGVQPGHAVLGVNHEGDVTVDWPHLGHVMVAGMTRYGKSNFLRLLAVQAIKDGHAIATVDHQDRTFARFAGHPSTFLAARNRASVPEAVVAIAHEHQRRERLFQTLAAQHPRLDLDDLEAYNQVAGEKIPRLMVFMDEFTALVNLYGKNSPFYEQLLTLVCESAKFGLHLIASGQIWEKQLAGAIREQMTTRVCFHVSTPSQSRIVLGENGGEHLQYPGRALTNHWHLMQTYLVQPTHLQLVEESRPSASLPMPEVSIEPGEPEGLTDQQLQQIRALLEAGQSARQMELALFGYTGGRAHERVKLGLAQLAATTTDKNTATVFAVAGVAAS